MLLPLPLPFLLPSLVLLLLFSLITRSTSPDPQVVPVIGMPLTMCKAYSMLVNEAQILAHDANFVDEVMLLTHCKQQA